MEFFLTIILYAVIAVHGTSDDSIENLLNESMMLIDNSQYKEALEITDRILTIDKNNLQALSNKGGLLIKLKRYDEAVEYFDKSLEIKPDFVEALNNKAIALYSLGNYDYASKVLLQAANLDPDNLTTIKNIGLVIEKTPYILENGYVKIEVSDENGDMVAYTEAYRFAIKYPFGNNLLTKNEWKDVVIKDQKLQKLENEWEFNIHINGLYSRTDITNNKNGPGFKVIEIIHDGILVKEGDRVKVTMNLFRSR